MEFSSLYYNLILPVMSAQCKSHLATNQCQAQALCSDGTKFTWLFVLLYCQQYSRIWRICHLGQLDFEELLSVF